MSLVSIEFNRRQVAELEQLCHGMERQLPRQLMRAVKDTGRATVTGINRDIRTEINIKASDLKPLIQVVYGTPSNPFARITLSESKRIPLKRFGARQTSKGVSYQIAKKGGRRTIPGAFGPAIPRLGEHVFRRAGDDRFPLVGPLKGPSPSEVFIRAGLVETTQSNAADLLNKNVGRRVDYMLLKRQGVLE